MNQNLYVSAAAYSTGFPWEIAGFFLFLGAMLGFLVWAIYAQPEDRISAGIRRPWSDDPDDLTAALEFPRKQARTGAAIRGERK